MSLREIKSGKNFALSAKLSEDILEKRYVLGVLEEMFENVLLKDFCGRFS